ncbi:universal stress protein [Pseudomonas sp. OTU5201]|uniref:universal stress protein n=1 Tax=Pseudomonas sp. OTU5201 TaxID=3043850 RepID=UPI00313E0BCA
MAERHGLSTEQRHFVMGHPISGIVEFADSENADVVVMGRIQRKGLGCVDPLPPPRPVRASVMLRFRTPDPA